MSWKTYRVINNNYYTTKTNKVIFIQANDCIYPYDDTLELNMLTKFKQDGNIDINQGVLHVASNVKIMIDINIFYKYAVAEFPPRFVLSLYKNNDLITQHYCGMNDTVVDMNNLYIVTVVDVSNNDILKIVMSKDSMENSTDSIEIMKNSYITYKTF